MSPAEIKMFIQPYLNQFLSADEQSDFIETNSAGRVTRRYKTVFTHIEFSGINMNCTEYSIYTNNHEVLDKLFDLFRTVDAEKFQGYSIYFMNARFPTKSVRHVYGRLIYDQANGNFACRTESGQIVDGKIKLWYKD